MGRTESPDTLKLVKTRVGSCGFFFIFAVFSIFYEGGSPQKSLGYLGNLPSGNIALQRSHCVLILKIYCLICLELKKVFGCNVENRFWHAESPSPLQSALRLLPGTAEEIKKGSRHQPAFKASAVITDKDKTGLSDTRPAAGNNYCLER